MVSKKNVWAITKKKNTSFRSNVKILTFSFDFIGIVHYNFVAWSYSQYGDLGVLCYWYKAIERNWSELLKDNSWILHYDNASTDNNIVVKLQPL